MDYLWIDEFFKFNCSNINAYVFKVAVKEIIPLYYVAVRGKNKEEGAVQRILSAKRIGDIANYVLKGNMFLNTFILNWASNEQEIEIGTSYIKIPKIPVSLQVLDGQHRLAGIQKACETDPSIGEKPILVVLTKNLSTTEAAEVFLNINYEQKQVPKSLVYDLFGELRDPEYNINRAREIAVRMNDDVDSPYYQCVKMPSASNKGRVDLSTMITSLKDYLKDGALFEQYNLNEFELQYKIISNYQCVLRMAYGLKWLSTDNPFMTNAGYTASIKFFCDRIIPICANAGTFEIEYIQRILNIPADELLLRSDIKNLQGKEQRQKIYEFLVEILTKDIPVKNGYRV